MLVCLELKTVFIIEIFDFPSTKFLLFLKKMDY